MFFDQFDHIYIVNLKTRPDRRREMQQQMGDLGLSNDCRVKFFDAIRTEEAGPFRRVGSHGAFLSHLAILKRHINSDDTVLILQDDCDFIPRVTETLINDEWDLFYGGYHQLDPGDLHASGIQGAHCMGFRPRIIPRLVDFLEAVYSGSCRVATPVEQGQSLSSIAPPIDGALVWFRRENPDVRTVFQRISYQRPSKTDIGDLSIIDQAPALALISRSLLRSFRRAKLRWQEIASRR